RARLLPRAPATAISLGAPPLTPILPPPPPPCPLRAHNAQPLRPHHERHAPSLAQTIIPRRPQPHASRRHHHVRCLHTHHLTREHIGLPKKLRSKPRPRLEVELIRRPDLLHVPVSHQADPVRHDHRLFL